MRARALTTPPFIINVGFVEKTRADLYTLALVSWSGTCFQEVDKHSVWLRFSEDMVYNNRININSNVVSVLLLSLSGLPFLSDSQNILF